LSFTWLATGEVHECTGLVRKVVKDGRICEKYHMIVGVEDITGEALPHDATPVTRVQELLAEYGAGRPEGYLAGCSDDFKGSVLDGLVPGAVFDSKEGFAKFMGSMGEVMEVSKFEPVNFVAIPNNGMMFNVNWQFTWLATGKEAETTAIARKVANKDGGLCQKYHFIDACWVVQESPRDVAAGAEA